MDEKGLGRVLSSVKRLASYSRFPKKRECKQSSYQSKHVTSYGYLTIYGIVKNRTNYQFGLIIAPLSF